MLNASYLLSTICLWVTWLPDGRFNLIAVLYWHTFRLYTLNWFVKWSLISFMFNCLHHGLNAMLLDAVYFLINLCRSLGPLNRRPGCKFMDAVRVSLMLQLQPDSGARLSFLNNSLGATLAFIVSGAVWSLSLDKNRAFSNKRVDFFCLLISLYHGFFNVNFVYLLLSPKLVCLDLPVRDFFLTDDAYLSEHIDLVLLLRMLV